MILFGFGTRPEWLKIKPIIKKMDIEKLKYGLLFTGQHSDIIDNYLFSKRNETNFCHFDIENNKNRLDSIVESIMNKLSDFKFHKYTHVLIQGDTTSAFAIALSAFHHRKKIIHLEAGLRTYDRNNPYPEETNRRMISVLTDYHLCPTNESAKNITLESYPDSVGTIIGNTILDNLLPYKEKCEYKDIILVTMHRRENHHWMDKWFKVINELAKKYKQYKFILPLHPNPNVKKHKHILKNVNVIDSLSHNELLDILVKTKLVITDSGGLQEECSFLNKKCLICRNTTERPEAVGLSTFLIENPDYLIDEFEKHIEKFEIDFECPFGKGDTSERIIKILKKEIYEKSN